jgi:3-oxoacyl-[acyl-carrier protein] reductase
MKALAGEYAGKKISINAVSPSMANTRFLSGLPQKLIEIVAEQHPLGRNARTEDVVPLIRFLLSEEAGYLTGVNIPVAGGLVF